MVCNFLTLDGGGAGVMVTLGERSLTLAGKPVDDLPNGAERWGGCGTEIFVRFNEPGNEGIWSPDLPGEGC